MHGVECMNKIKEMGVASGGGLCTVVGDGVLGHTLSADLDDLVRGGLVEHVDQGSGHIGEDDLIPRVVEEAGDEAPADIAGAKVNGFLGGRHGEREINKADRDGGSR